jgi:hypothetical protein
MLAACILSFFDEKIECQEFTGYLATEKTSPEPKTTMENQA